VRDFEASDIHVLRLLDTARYDAETAAQTAQILLDDASEPIHRRSVLLAIVATGRLARGEVSSALDLATTALNDREADDRSFLGEIIAVRAACLTAAGRLAESMEMLEATRGEVDNADQWMLDKAVADVHYQLGQLVDARNAESRVLAAMPAGRSTLRARILSNRGATGLHLGDLTQARADLELAEAIFREQGLSGGPQSFRRHRG
jgi:tetratricopeptide (TPR) repeat protein